MDQQLKVLPTHAEDPSYQHPHQEVHNHSQLFGFVGMCMHWVYIQKHTHISINKNNIINL